MIQKKVGRGDSRDIEHGMKGPTDHLTTTPLAPTGGRDEDDPWYMKLLLFAATSALILLVTVYGMPAAAAAEGAVGPTTLPGGKAREVTAQRLSGLRRNEGERGTVGAAGGEGEREMDGLREGEVLRGERKAALLHCAPASPSSSSRYGVTVSLQLSTSPRPLSSMGKLDEAGNPPSSFTATGGPGNRASCSSHGEPSWLSRSSGDCRSRWTAKDDGWEWLRSLSPRRAAGESATIVGMGGGGEGRG